MDKTPKQAAKRGRPAGGKSSSPDYRQVTIYLKRTTYAEIQHRLVDGNGQLSELMQQLLRNG